MLETIYRHMCNAMAQFIAIHLNSCDVCSFVIQHVILAIAESKLITNNGVPFYN